MPTAPSANGNPNAGSDQQAQAFQAAFQALQGTINEHLQYTAVAVVISALIAIPIGMIIGHTGRGTFLVVTGVNALRALPTLGVLLLGALIERAKAGGKHVMVAAIESGNSASIGLHQRFGFTITGQMPQVGRKFGRWLDLTFMQLILTPERSAP